MKILKGIQVTPLYCRKLIEIFKLFSLAYTLLNNYFLIMPCVSFSRFLLNACTVANNYVAIHNRVSSDTITCQCLRHTYPSACWIQLWQFLPTDCRTMFWKWDGNTAIIYYVDFMTMLVVLSVVRNLLCLSPEVLSRFRLSKDVNWPKMKVDEKRALKYRFDTHRFTGDQVDLITKILLNIYCCTTWRYRPLFPWG